MNKNNRILILLIIVFLLGGFLGSLFFSVSLVGADSSNNYAANKSGLFQDLFNKYFEPIIQKLYPQSPKGSPLIPNINLPTSQSPTIPYSPTIDYEQAVVNTVQEASPAVVSIIISKYVPVIEQCPYNPFSNLPPDIQQFFGQQFQFSQPCQKGTTYQEVGGGSGFIISSDGLIVTNKHVVSDENADYTVFTNDGKKYKAEVLARDPAQDLAVIKISSNNLSTLNLGNSDSIKLGQTAIAIGNALGEFRNTVSVGVISGLSRNIVAAGGGTTERIEGVIQTDAAINQGNSGGPLLNLKGEVIGINVATVYGAQNIGFALPINQVKKAIESVRISGRIITPYLGIRYLIITPDLAQQEKLPVENGVLVRGSENGSAVIPNSPAAKAGIQTEDIILSVNNEQITIDNSLGSLIQKYNVGNTIVLKILRSGKEMIFNVVLEERPKNL